MITQDSTRLWIYQLDTEGTLYHEGMALDDPAMIRMFMTRLEEYEPGKFRVYCQGEECRLVPSDVPYVIQDVDLQPDTIRLVFSGGYEEKLDPSSLFVGKENVLYCRVRQGRFTARFTRKSYMQISKRIGEDPSNGVYFIEVHGTRYLIRNV